MILVIGALISGGAVIVLAGYATNLDPLKSWGGPLAMAPSTAGLFLLTGCSLIVIGIGRKGSDTNYERREE